MSNENEDLDAIEELVGPNPDYNAQSPDEYGAGAEEPEEQAAQPAQTATAGKKQTPAKKPAKKPTKDKEDGSADEPETDLAELQKTTEAIVTKLDDLLYYSEQHRVGGNKLQEQLSSVADVLVNDIPNQINSANEGIDTATKDLVQAASAMKKGRGKQKRAPSKVIMLATALIFGAAGAAGAYVLKPAEIRIKEVPVETQTSSGNPWKDAIWQHHGEQIIECYRVARQRNKVMDCIFAVK